MDMLLHWLFWHGFAWLLALSIMYNLRNVQRFVLTSPC